MTFSWSHPRRTVTHSDVTESLNATLKGFSLIPTCLQRGISLTKYHQGVIFKHISIKVCDCFLLYSQWVKGRVRRFALFLGDLSRSFACGRPCLSTSTRGGPPSRSSLLLPLLQSLQTGIWKLPEARPRHRQGTVNVCCTDDCPAITGVSLIGAIGFS